MGFREQSAVEKAQAKDAQRGVRGILAASGQQLLRDRVAIIVSEHERVAPTVMLRDRFCQIRLFAHTIAMAARFGGKAQAQQIECQHLEARGQHRPHRRPIDAAGREAMNQQQPWPRSSPMAKDALATDGDEFAGLPPGAQRRKAIDPAHGRPLVKGRRAIEACSAGKRL